MRRLATVCGRWRRRARVPSRAAPCSAIRTFSARAFSSVPLRWFCSLHRAMSSRSRCHSVPRACVVVDVARDCAAATRASRALRRASLSHRSRAPSAFVIAVGERLRSRGRASRASLRRSGSARSRTAFKLGCDHGCASLAGAQPSTSRSNRSSLSATALIVDLVGARCDGILDRGDALCIHDRRALHELLELAQQQARLRDADGVARRRRLSAVAARLCPGCSPAWRLPTAASRRCPWA